LGKILIRAKLKSDKDEEDYLIVKTNKNYFKTQLIEHLIDALQAILTEYYENEDL